MLTSARSNRARLWIWASLSFTVDKSPADSNLSRSILFLLMISSKTTKEKNHTNYGLFERWCLVWMAAFSFLCIYLQMMVEMQPCTEIRTWKIIPKLHYWSDWAAKWLKKPLWHRFTISRHNGSFWVHTFPTQKHVLMHMRNNVNHCYGTHFMLKLNKQPQQHNTIVGLANQNHQRKNKSDSLCKCKPVHHISN